MPDSIYHLATITLFVLHFLKSEKSLVLPEQYAFDFNTFPILFSVFHSLVHVHRLSSLDHRRANLFPSGLTTIPFAPFSSLSPLPPRLQTTTINTSPQPRSRSTPLQYSHCLFLNFNSSTPSSSVSISFRSIGRTISTTSISLRTLQCYILSAMSAFHRCTEYHLFLLSR